jgi:hypothetical protein
MPTSFNYWRQFFGRGKFKTFKYPPRAHTDAKFEFLQWWVVKVGSRKTIQELSIKRTLACIRFRFCSCFFVDKVLKSVHLLYCNLFYYSSLFSPVFRRDLLRIIYRLLLSMYCCKKVPLFLNDWFNNSFLSLTSWPQRNREYRKPKVTFQSRFRLNFLYVF